MLSIDIYIFVILLYADNYRVATEEEINFHGNRCYYSHGFPIALAESDIKTRSRNFYGLKWEFDGTWNLISRRSSPQLRFIRYRVIL